MYELPVPIVIHCQNVYTIAHDGLVCILFYFDTPWHPGLKAANEDLTWPPY